MLAFLARVVRDRISTEESAAEVLRKYDADELPANFELPIPPEAFITGLTGAKVAEALR